MYMPFVEFATGSKLTFVCNWEHSPAEVPCGEHNRLIELSLRWNDSVLPYSDTSSVDESGAFLSAEARLLGKTLEHYEQGALVEWPVLPLYTKGLTPFALQVLRVLQRDVEYGTTVSYKELAAMAGRPGAARGVGQIMGRNRWSLIYPAHRVITSSGALGGFGSEGERLKRYLLELEGALH